MSTSTTIFGNKNDNDEQQLFFGNSISIARYDKLQYPQLDKITDKQIGFFWRPEEVDLSRDRLDFKKLSKNEQHIFTSNLKRQIVLDSIQGRAPSETLLAISSVPELEPLILGWGFIEGIHSRSYTHIIRNIYPDPSVVFDQILDIEEIVDCATDITKDYDQFIRASKYYQLLGTGEFEITERGKSGISVVNIDLFELKRRLWRVLHAINVLEGIRFYVSFACAWNFAEQKKMEGNAKIIRLIARDENLHLATTQMLIKLLLRSDESYREIQKLEHDNVINIFISAIEQEKKWSEYLFQDGSMLGLNHRLLSEYIEWIGAKRIKSLQYKVPFSTSQQNPLPWTEKWISQGSKVQVAPQETEVQSYVIGGIKNDINNAFFDKLKL